MAEVENSPSNSQGSSTHPHNPSLSPSTLPSFPQKEEDISAMDTSATAPPENDTHNSHRFQCFNADEISKYDKFEADYAGYLRAKYFSDKDVYGGDIYDLTVTIGNETIKASRWSPIRSFADPARGFLVPAHVLASDVELPTPGVETSPNIANGNITPEYQREDFRLLSRFRRFSLKEEKEEGVKDANFTFEFSASDKQLKERSFEICSHARGCPSGHNARHRSKDKC